MRHLNLTLHSKAGLTALALVSLALQQGNQVHAQGCVAVRGGGMGTMNHVLGTEGVGLEGSQWMARRVSKIGDYDVA